VADDETAGVDETTGGEQTEEELAAELAAARAESERLRAEVEKLKPARRHRLRRILTPILAALTVITFTVAVPSAWARRTIVNDNAYAKAITPLASDPAVQAYLARVITNQVFATLNVQQVIANALPDQATILAGPLTSAAQEFVHKQVLRVVQSDAFQRLWVDANKLAHAEVLAVLNGEVGDFVSTARGQVVLNLLPMVNLALQQLHTIASGLLPSGVSIPTVTVNEVPQEAIQRIEQAFGVTLPDTFGTVVVYDSDNLAAVQQTFHRVERLVALLVILWILFFVATMWVAVRKRRALLQITIGSALGLVLVRRGSLIAINHVLDGVKPENRAAAQAVADSLTHGLRVLTGWLLVIALIVAVVALVTGPYPWAARLRGWVTGLGKALAGAPGAMRSEPVAAWTRAHSDLLMAGGAAVGVLLLLLLNVSFWGFLIIAVLVGLFELAVFRVRATPTEPSDPVAEQT
jgi:hypothetical protein